MCHSVTSRTICANRSIDSMSIKVIKVLKVQSPVYTEFCSISAIWRILLSACKAACLLGRNTGASALRTLKGVPAIDSEESSRGYRCCTGLSRKFLPDRTFTALTTPSLPGYSSLTIPSGHLPLFFSSDLIITTSPTAKVQDFPECLRLCFSLRLRRYSFDHRFQIASLHWRRCQLALRRRSASAM